MYQHEEEKEADAGEACLPGALLPESGQTIMPVIDCTKSHSNSKRGRLIGRHGTEQRLFASSKVLTG